MDLETILDNCLQRMEAGEDIASCLASYPDHAEVLAPMLAAASQLEALREERLNDAERARARALLRSAIAAQQVRVRQPRWSALLRGGRAAALVGVACALLFVVVTISAVAGSQPGELLYRARIMAERAAVLAQPAAGARAAAGVDFAQHRLADVMAGYVADGRADPAALDALVRGVEDVANTADNLSPEKRLDVARRVKAQADQLHQLAQSAGESPAAPAFRSAADRAYAVARRLGLRPDETTPPLAPTLQPAVVTHTPQAAADATPTPRPVVSPSTAMPATMSSPSPSRTLGPEMPGPTVTPTASSTPQPVPPTAVAGTGSDRSTIPRRSPTSIPTATMTPTVPAATASATSGTRVLPSTAGPSGTSTPVSNTTGAASATATPAPKTSLPVPSPGTTRKPPRPTGILTPARPVATPEKSPAVPRPTAATSIVDDVLTSPGAATSAVKPGNATVPPAVDAGKAGRP